MKKIENIYEKICSVENLYAAASMAAKGRRYRDSTADFTFRLEAEISRLKRELEKGTYRHGAYRVFVIHDPKERLISAAPFRDRVVHHAVHDVIEPLLDRTFIYDSYACRKTKGTHKAVDRAQSFLRVNKFCLHCDVKKYFQSIDHGILKGVLARCIGDVKTLSLLDTIIDSSAYLADISAANRIAGLPIGNLTSQFFANLYLNELDYYVKFSLGRRYYLRYMDDFLVFGNDRAALEEIKDRIREFLRDKLNVALHEGKSQVFNTQRGIKFLGFRLYKDFRRLATGNVKRFKRRLKRFRYLLEKGEADREKIRDSVRCWTAHSLYADTHGLRSRLLVDLMQKDAHFGKGLKDILLPAGGRRDDERAREAAKSKERSDVQEFSCPRR
jgi:retron-type reverse transcriptase